MILERLNDTGSAWYAQDGRLPALRRIIPLMKHPLRALTFAILAVLLVAGYRTAPTSVPAAGIPGPLPDVPAVLAHGFLRDLESMRGWAELWAPPELVPQL